MKTQNSFYISQTSYIGHLCEFRLLENVIATLEKSYLNDILTER